MSVAIATPRAQGYRMPAEWDLHQATWLAWPHNPEDWPGKFQTIPWVYAEIIRLLSAVEQVHLLVQHEREEARAKSILTRTGAKMENVLFHPWLTDRIWMRDAGPIFVRNGEGKVGLINWRFNAWAKYDNWQLDDQVPARVTELLGVPAWMPFVGDHRVVLEGGSIDTDGAGTMLTTEECLLSEVQQRNPGLKREQLEQVFSDNLGIDRVLWLDRGIAGDDTHGHVDDITRFVTEDTIVTCVEPDTTDVNHEILAENLRRLKQARTASGKQYTLVELPLPKPVIFDGQRLPASYANFYIANNLVLVPTFNDPRDRVALSILAECFPTREVVGIHAVDLVWGLGTLHCMSQQQPAELTAKV